MTYSSPGHGRSVGPETNELQVWDPFVRIFHWTVVAAFFVAYVTEDDLLSAHVWAGYLVGILLILRIAWGFVGPQHARFSDFMAPASVISRYLVDLVQFRARRYVGHSPAGGAMVIALLVMLAAVVCSGLPLYAARNGAGPLADIVVRNRPLARALAGLHEILANVTLALVGLHIFGVLFASLAHGENLIRSMVTGRKPRREP
ncbi:MAG: cytochrome b/b6 domain-containing protein [Gemmatimonas sp.]